MIFFTFFQFNFSHSQCFHTFVPTCGHCFTPLISAFKFIIVLQGKELLVSSHIFYIVSGKIPYTQGKRDLNSKSVSLSISHGL